ncbi:septum formation family protein [Spirillospora sp. NBC_00431]
MERSDAMAAELRDIAGPNLYRRNAFRVIGLPTAANAADVRRRQQQVESVVSIDPEMLAGLGVHGDAEEVQAAFGLIRDDRRRLVHEMFWLWDTPEATCSCPASLHKTHDTAVRTHAEVLDREAESPGPGSAHLWRKAALYWGQVLRDDAYLQHVQDRAERLGDRRLDASEIERQFREGLPAALVKPVLRLAGEADDPAYLTEIARGWPGPGHIIDDEFENLIAAMLETVRKALERIAGSETPAETTGEVRREVLPVLKRLSGLDPSGRQSASAHDQTSVVLNNAANEMLTEPGALDERAILDALELALDVVDDPEGRRAIETNLAEIRKLFEVLDKVEAQARRMVERGRPAAATRYLRFLRRRIGDAGGAAVLDHLVDQIDSGRPLSWRTTGGTATVGSRRPASTSRPRPYTPRGSVRPGRGRLRALFKFVVVALAMYLIFTVTNNLVDNDNDDDSNEKSAMLWSERIEDNAPPKACVSTRKGWEKDNQVPTVPCDEPHWGEVLGYVRLGDVPSPYPGDDQSEALARFECGRLREHQRLPSGYLVTYRLPDATNWNDGGPKRYENYTTCVAFRRDERMIEGGAAAHFPAEPLASQAAKMSVFSDEVRFNAPVGTCMRSRPVSEDGWYDAHIVHCGQPHWARILGYPAVFPPGTEWPGDAAVRESAKKKCEDLHNGASDDLLIEFLWPDKGVFTKKKSLYATCMLHRADDRPMTD